MSWFMFPNWMCLLWLPHQNITSYSLFYSQISTVKVVMSYLLLQEIFSVTWSFFFWLDISLFSADECLLCSCILQSSLGEMPKTSKSTSWGIKAGFGGLSDICPCLVAISSLCRCFFGGKHKYYSVKLFITLLSLASLLPHMVALHMKQAIFIVCCLIF